MIGIQFISLMFVAVLTSANPTANGGVSITSVTEKINDKEVPKITSECVPFKRPADCEEVRLNGNTTSGVYTIWPKSRRAACKSTEVYCDMTTAGGGWTVLQRRGQYGNAQNYFNKTWDMYKQGFGELEKEFWIGNEMIFALTNQGPYSVRFDMRHVNGTSAYAMYDQFWIDDEDRKYQLNIVGYSGNAGDSMVYYHHGMKFTTVDQDNGKAGYNCALTKTGGWWFHVCHRANLNGINWKGKYVDPNNNGIMWESFSGWTNSLEFSEIKIKPRHFR